MRAKSRIRPGQILIVSVIGTAVPGADREQLAEDYALCARWAADAGADVIEVHLACPNVSNDQPQMIFEDLPLAAYIVDQVRRAVGLRPLIAKLGAMRSPRALHDLASRLAPRLDGFILVGGLRRRVVKADGTPAFSGEARAEADIVGAGVYAPCQVQVEELLAWRKAGAWSRAILAVGGLTSVERARHALDVRRRCRHGGDGGAVGSPHRRALPDRIPLRPSCSAGTRTGRRAGTGAADVPGGLCYALAYALARRSPLRAPRAHGDGLRRRTLHDGPRGADLRLPARQPAVQEQAARSRPIRAGSCAGFEATCCAVAARRRARHQGRADHPGTSSGESRTGWTRSS